MNPVFMFTYIGPDGRPHIWSLTIGMSHLFYIFLAILGCFGLAFMKAVEIVNSILQFFLTSPEPTLIRFFAFTLALLLVLLFVQWMRSRSACSKKAGALI